MNDHIIVSGATDKTIKIHYLFEDQECLVLKEHSSFISSLQSIDNRFFLSGSNDRTIKLWDSNSGEVLQTFSGHSSSISDLVINEELIASASFDKTVKIWNRKTNELAHTFTAHGSGVTSVALLPNNQMVSGTRKGKVYFWDLSTGKNIKTVDLQSWISAIAIDAKGNLIIATRKNNVSRLNAENEKKTIIREGPFLQKKALLTNDGIIISQTLEKEIYRWEILTDKILIKNITNEKHSVAERINNLDRSYEHFVFIPIAEFIMIEIGLDRLFKKFANSCNKDELLSNFIKGYQNIQKRILNYFASAEGEDNKNYQLIVAENGFIPMEPPKEEENNLRSKQRRKVRKILISCQEIWDKIQTK
jgi:WD40 repeat protein